MSEGSAGEREPAVLLSGGILLEGCLKRDVDSAQVCSERGSCVEVGVTVEHADARSVTVSSVDLAHNSSIP